MGDIQGSCLCGEVTFSCENKFKAFHLCHCIECQKATGSAHASNLFTAIDNLKWLSGEALVRRYDLPGRAISKAFCSQCGSGVPYISGSGRALIVPAGCLDGEPTKVPQDNIFWGERACWYDEGIQATKFDRFPEKS